MRTTFSVVRYHDISCGHRVAGHESKCANIHGHNYRITFYCTAPQLDSLGRVIDFSVVKEKLCVWLEEKWDHKFLLWHMDVLLPAMIELPGLCQVPFNPTAEDMAQYLLEVVGPYQLEGTGITLQKVVVEETRKCSVHAELE